MEEGIDQPSNASGEAIYAHDSIWRTPGADCYWQRVWVIAGGLD